MSRLRRIAVSDRYFFVTCNLARGRSMLREPEFENLSSAIAEAREGHGFRLTAWVFLPDHWHAIVYPRHPVTISGVLKAIKLRTTSAINERRSQSGPVWQGRFFDHILRTVKEYWETVDYIHMNPVRRGLVSRPLVEHSQISKDALRGSIPNRCGEPPVRSNLSFVVKSPVAAFRGDHERSLVKVMAVPVRSIYCRYNPRKSFPVHVITVNQSLCDPDFRLW